MEYVIAFIFGIFLLTVVYLFGYNYAGIQVRKDRNFKSAFKRSTAVVAILTVLFTIPIATGAGLSAVFIRDAWTQAYPDFTGMALAEEIITGMLSIFAMFAIPFFAGLWMRYRKITEIAQA